MTQKSTDKWITDLAGTFTDPIIVCPGGWGDSLPDWIKQAITVERLIANLTTPEMATDAEACAYLFTACLTAPIDSDWTQIYIYLTTKTVTRHRKTDIPEDLRVDSISDYQKRKLDELKFWIYSKRVKARPKAERRPKEEQRKIEQPMLFALS